MDQPGELNSNVQSLRHDIVQGITTSAVQIITDAVDRYKAKVKKDRHQGNIHNSYGFLYTHYFRCP
jgi:hypothetical protein